jgi:PAS domain S-box-containing protein
LKYIHFLLQGYRLAVSATLVVFGVTLLVGSWSDRTAFALFLCATVVSAYFGGLRPGALSVGLGCVFLLIEYTFIHADSPYRNEIDFVPSLLLFVAVGALVTYLSHECRKVVKGPSPVEGLADRREAVLLADGKSQVAYLNDAARTLSGWPGNDAVGQALDKFFRLLDEGSRQPVKDPLGRVKSAASSPSPVATGLFVCKDGSEKGIEYWLESLPDPQGGAPRVLCVFRDVSEQRRAEKERKQYQEQRNKLESDLAESKLREDHYASLEKAKAELEQQLAELRQDQEILREENAELLKQGQASQDEHAEGQRVEEALRREQATWLKTEEKLRHQIAELQTAKDLAEEQIAVQQKETDSLRQGHKDAAEHKLAAEKLKDQHQKERKRWQEERDRLQQAHQEVTVSRAALDKDMRLLRVMLTNLGDGVCAVDREGTVTFVNAAAEKLLGRSAADLLGKGLDAYRVAETNGTITERLIPRPLASRTVVRKDKVAFRRQDGTVAVVACSIAALADPENGEGAALCFHDVSGRARREEELTLQVQRLNEAVRRMDTFLDRLTERFRPGLLRMRDAALLPESHDLFGYQLQRLTRMVDNVWTVSRLAHDKLALNTQTVDLEEIVRRAVHAFSPLLQARRQHLTVSLPLEPEALVGDTDRLEQILVEVLDNAARYSAPGGNIRFSAERQGERMVLRIHDGGRGIEGGVLSQLADLSARERRFWEQSPEGLGVGLALVHNLVEMHGGKVELTSNGAGHGSELILRLPAAPCGVHPGAEAEGMPVYKGPKGIRTTEQVSE